MQTITQTMLQEHGKIRSMLMELERISDKQQLKKQFNKFKWTLEKHFFVEEKVIFSIYNDEENRNNLDTVLKEHKDMILLIQKAEDALDEGYLELLDLKTILECHAIFETDILYPKLDAELDQEQRSLILDRASEIIRE